MANEVKIYLKFFKNDGVVVAVLKDLENFYYILTFNINTLRLFKHHRCDFIHIQKKSKKGKMRKKKFKGKKIWFFSHCQGIRKFRETFFSSLFQPSNNR
jgi:hypothetical protein